jgi:hypothetical protein
MYLEHIDESPGAHERQAEHALPPQALVQDDGKPAGVVHWLILQRAAMVKTMGRCGSASLISVPTR